MLPHFKHRLSVCDWYIQPLWWENGLHLKGCLSPFFAPHKVSNKVFGNVFFPLSPALLYAVFLLYCANYLPYISACMVCNIIVNFCIAGSYLVSEKGQCFPAQLAAVMYFTSGSGCSHPMFVFPDYQKMRHDISRT